MEKIAKFLQFSLLLGLNLALAGLLVGGWRAYQALHRLDSELLATLSAVRRSSEQAEGLLGTYKADLESDRNRKAVAAGLAAAASWQATARLVNTQLVPEAKNSLRGLSETTGELRKLIQDQNRELALTQQQGREAIATLDEQLEGLGPEIARLTTASSLAVEEGTRSLQHLTTTSAELERLAGNLEQASREAPAMAKSLEKILATGGRWQRPISVATLLIALLGAIR